MWSHQIFVAFLILSLASQQTAAVVNSGQSQKPEESKATVNTDNEKPNESNVTDSTATSSEQQSNRREAPSTLSDGYGAPVANTYFPTGQSYVGLPVPIYGVPSLPTNNVVYPAPPPESPPPVASPLYGAPPVYGVPQIKFTNSYIPPAASYGAVKYSVNQKYGPNRGIKPVYGVPSFSYGPPAKFQKFKGTYRPSKPLNGVYGAPLSFKDNYSAAKQNFYSAGYLNNANSIRHVSQSVYSGQTPNFQYGVPLAPAVTTSQFVSTQYGAPAQVSTPYGAPPQYDVHAQSVSTQYGVPSSGHYDTNIDVSYGPPQPSPNPKPPHPGAPAPPTPPDIKYDGWQPIPGLISKKPEPVYGAPDVHQVVDDGYSNLSPPPLGDGSNNGLGATYGAPATVKESYGPPPAQKGLSDSYGAPLNTVTGSGGIIASSGDEVHGKTHADSSLALGLNQVTDIQALKSVAYELFPDQKQVVNSYSAPQVNSYALDGAYAATHSYNNFGSNTRHSGLGAHKTSSYKGLSLGSSGIGLIPPSGVYGLPSRGQYGTPLIGKVSQPKRPVFHREPVPSGLFQSLAKQSAFNEIHGAYSGHVSTGSTYVPPPVSDIPKPPEPSGLYALPHAQSYQNFAQGSSYAGLNQNLQIHGATASALSSYNVPLAAIDGSYGGISSVGLDLSHPPVTIDLTQDKALTSSLSLPHNCHQVSQQVPSLAYGVPSVDSYTSSLSSLTTNIGAGQTSSIVPHATYGAPDLTNLKAPQAEYGAPDLAYSPSIKSESTVNFVDSQSHGKTYGKSVAESFGPNSELIESQSIDLNNIPLKGTLGTYTLQIQSADGRSGQSQVVPHSQVLNEGLLQSILAAIEQPGKSVIQEVQPSVEKESYSTNQTQTIITVRDSEQRNSEKDSVEASSNNVETEDRDEKLQLLEDNGIALYFSNNSVKSEDRQDRESVGTSTEVSVVYSTS